MGLTEDNPLITPQRVVALLKGKGLQPSLVPGDDEAVIVRVGESNMTVVVSMMELKIFCRFDDLSKIGPRRGNHFGGNFTVTRCSLSEPVTTQ